MYSTVYHKEHIDGTPIAFRLQSKIDEAEENAHYQLWPTRILRALIEEENKFNLNDFLRENVYGMMHHSTSTERAVKASKRVVTGKSQMSGSTLSAHAVGSSTRQGTNHEVALEVVEERDKTLSPIKATGFAADGAHLRKISDRLCAFKDGIPPLKYHECRQAFDSMYSKTPSAALEDSALAKVNKAVDAYSGVASSLDIGLTEQNDETTIGPEASGKLKLNSINSVARFTEYLLSWGHTLKGDEAYDDLKAMAKVHKIGNLEKRERQYWALNRDCVSGHYAYKSENRTAMPSGSTNELPPGTLKLGSLKSAITLKAYLGSWEYVLTGNETFVELKNLAKKHKVMKGKRALWWLLNEGCNSGTYAYHPEDRKDESSSPTRQGN